MIRPALLRTAAMTDVDWELVFRYLGNECTPEERAQFERWLAADPQRRTLVQAAIAAAERTLDELRVATPPPRRLAAWERPSAFPLHRLAAAALFLFAVATGVLWTRPDWTRGLTWNRAPERRVATAAPRSRRALHLSDGTRVLLATGSTLRYPADFGSDARDVELVGEGYFEVVHDAAHPFRVHAGHAVAEDIGTAFVVTAYAQDTAVRVVVAQGSVALARASASMTRGGAALLMRGDLGTLASGASRVTVRQVNVAAYTAWTEGRLVFDDTPLEESLLRLGRWYGVPFRLADRAIAPRTLTATFTTESLDDVLAALAPVLDVRFERVRDTIVVRSLAAHPARRSR